MPVRDARAVLSKFVGEHLEALNIDDLDLIYDVDTLTRIEACCPEHDDCDMDEEPHHHERTYWRVHIHVNHEDDRHSVVGAQVPYDYCNDGDTEPMQRALDLVWESLTFNLMMRVDDLDKTLDEVARSHEA